jgi:hypothetical protein
MARVRESRVHDSGEEQAPPAVAGGACGEPAGSVVSGPGQG